MEKQTAILPFVKSSNIWINHKNIERLQIVCFIIKVCLCIRYCFLTWRSIAKTRCSGIWLNMFQFCVQTILIEQVLPHSRKFQQIWFYSLSQHLKKNRTYASGPFKLKTFHVWILWTQRLKNFWGFANFHWNLSEKLRKFLVRVSHTVDWIEM